MPPPYNQQHNGYLKRYMSTGAARILSIRQKLEGRHKKGHNFALNLMVTKIESGGDVSFMGVRAAPHRPACPTQSAGRARTRPLVVRRR